MAGLKPIAKDGSEFKGNLTTVELTTGTVLGKYDPLLIGGTPTLGRGPKVARAVGTEGTPGTIQYVFMGLEDTVESATPNYYDGNAVAVGKAMLITPDMRFEMEDDDGSLALADVGSVCDMVVSNADSTTGESNVQLDSSAAATGGSQQFVILDVSQEVGHALGTASDSKVIVKLNEAQLVDSFAGV